MRVFDTRLAGVLIIEAKVYRDSRGFFKEAFQARRYFDFGIKNDFVQDNFSRSKKDVLRGLHFQIDKPQGKLVSCTRGGVFDVVVDIDPSSVTFGHHVGIELTEDNHRQLWVPSGYAHGFCVLTDSADLQYKCTDYYDPLDESGLIWCDPDVGIVWPVKQPLISDKDAKLPSLHEIANRS